MPRAKDKFRLILDISTMRACVEDKSPGSSEILAICRQGHVEVAWMLEESVTCPVCGARPVSNQIQPSVNIIVDKGKLP